jgi:hypothetical protein
MLALRQPPVMPDLSVVFRTALAKGFCFFGADETKPVAAPAAGAWRRSSRSAPFCLTAPFPGLE